MRRSALAGALAVLLIGGLLLARPFLTRERDLLTTTPQPFPLDAVALVDLRGHDRGCLEHAVMDERSGQVRFRVATYRRSAMPLRVTIRGRGYADTQRVAPRYHDNDLLTLPVAAPHAPLPVSVCIRNEGRHKIALYAADDRTRSSLTTTVGGAPVHPNIVVQFAERRPASLLAHLPVIMRRLTVFRPVGEWLTWPLAILFAVGLPVGVLFAYARSVQTVEAEDAAAAAALAGRRAAPRQPLRERYPRLARVGLVPSAWLAAIVGVAFVLGTAFALSLVQYFVMPDELGYVKQASHIAATAWPSMRGDMWFNSYAQLWPLVIAPGYGMFSTPTAFDVAHVLAAAAIASTAVPAYLLAGRASDRQAGRLFAAALTVVVPWLALSGTMMTESLAYPLFTWALLACTVAVERPSAARDAVALIAIGLCFLTRVQLALLAVAFVAAVVLHELTFTDGGQRRRSDAWRRMAQHRLLLGVVAAGGVLLLGGLSLRTIVGNYAIATENRVLLDGVITQARELLAYVALGVAVLPLALAPAWVLLELARPRNAASHALAAVAFAALVTMVLATATFSAHYTTAVNDRYLIYIVPLLTIGSAALLFDRRPATLPLAAGGAFAAAVFATASLPTAGPSAVSPTYALNTVLQGRGAQIVSRLDLGGMSPADLVAAAIVVVVVALVVARRRWSDARLAVGVSAVLLLVSLTATRYVLDTIKRTQVGASLAFIDGRNWLDRSVGPDAKLGAVLSFVDSPSASTASWWDVNFWNKRVDRVYQLPGGDGYEQGFVRPFAIDPRTGGMPELDERALLVLGTFDRRFALRGAHVVGGNGPFEIVQAPRPYRAKWMLHAARDDGLLSAGRRARLTIFGVDRGPRDMLVRLRATASPQAAADYRLVARSASGREWSVRVPRRGRATLRATIRVPAGGSAPLRLSLRGGPRRHVLEAGVIVDRVVSRRA